tara:strand:+ start:355 stop:1008 length:654 start_codon:yes stop_codon:yes gene_type:complete
MAYRTIINKVLRRLREDTVAADWIGDLADSDADDYQKLIGDFVNEAKQIVEDAWSWSFLRSLQTITTSASTATYAIPSATNRTTILQVIDDSNDFVIPQMSDADFYNFTFVGTTQNGSPLFYRLNGTDISFYPTPDAAYTIKVHMVLPQDDLTEATTTLTVPEQPVVLGAYSLALAERGEDGGTTASIAGGRFEKALADFISKDSNRTLNETVWYAT